MQLVHASPAQQPCDRLGAACGRNCLCLPASLSADDLPSSTQAFRAQRIWGHYTRGELPEARRMLRLLQETPYQDDQWGYVLSQLEGLLLLTEGEDEAAAELYSQLSKLPGVATEEHLREHFLAALFGWSLAAYSLNEREDFEKLVSIYRQIGTSGCSCTYKLHGSLLVGLQALLHGQPQSATLAFQAVRAYERVDLHYPAVALLGMAEAALLSSDTDAARERLLTLQSLLDRGQGYGAVTAYIRRARPYFPKTASLIAREFTRWPQALSASTELSRAYDLGRTGSELRLHVLGEPRCVLRGSPVVFSRDGAMPGNPRAPLAFLTLLALHPEGLDSADIRLTLWPESTTDSPLDKMLAVVREGLGADAVGRRHGVVRLQLDYWIDLGQYLELYTQAQGVPLRNRLELLEALRQLYRGPLLMGMKTNWVEDQRQRYSEMACQVLCDLAAIYATDNPPQLHESVSYLEQAMEVNPLSDSTMVLLLRTYEQMGERSAGVRRAQLYVERIHQTLGVTPSVELQSLLARFHDDPQRQLTAPFSVEMLMLAARRQPKPAGSRGVPELPAPYPARGDSQFLLGEDAPWPPSS